ncbi:MAG TPA: NAD-binding protein [Polyangia bacterium]|nr:NAD-binding protein [Polyangia bacterium]
MRRGDLSTSRRHKLKTAALYVRTLVHEFRWTLLFLAAAQLTGTTLYAITPHRALAGFAPSLMQSFYGAWMALFAQPILSPPETWYLAMVCAIYPLFGFVLVGEGVVRLSTLIISKQQGERKWMKVMASTYRDHVVLCGLGHLGFRILGQLRAAGVSVVAVEKAADGRFMGEAKATGIPILINDMKDDNALIEAGVPHARCIIIATDDDMANLEVALDAKRMNPAIRVVLRMFDQQIASKVKDAFTIDHAFSSAALAAPIVAAMSSDAGVLASYPIGDVAHLTAELAIASGSALTGRTVADLESRYSARVLALRVSSGATPSLPPPTAILSPGDRVIVHVAAERMAPLAAAATAAA